MSRRRHRRLQGPPLGRQAGLYVAARRPRPASPVRTRRSHILPPQPPAQTQYVRPRAPCTSAPPHADGEEWGGLDRDVFSRAAGARCLGSSEGCPARPIVSLSVDGRPIPTVLRHRHVLERLWSERGGRRPPWDLLRLPALRRICTSGAAPAHAGARSSAPGGSLPVVPRGGRSRRAAWTGGPSRGFCARFTLRTRLPPGGVAGAAAGLRRGRPARAPRRRAARRGRPRPFHFSRRLCSSPRFRLHG